MSAKRSIAVLLAVVAVAAPLSPSGAHTTASDRFASGRVLVHFSSGTPRAVRARILASSHATVVRRIPLIDVDVVTTPLPVTEVVRALEQIPAVAFAEPDYLGNIAISPNDTCVSGCADGVTQWDIGAVNAEAGWDIVPGSFLTQTQKKATTQVKVAVLDTKVDTRPLDWVNAGAPQSNAPWDAAQGGQLDMADATDEFLTNRNYTGANEYHGTFVASLIGAAANNQLAIAGLGYSAQVMPVTVVDGSGGVAASDLAQGIAYAWSHGARVINMSLGLADYSQTVQNAIYAVTKPVDGRPGALAIAAAGNNASDAPFYPASMKQVMAVSATDRADRPGTCTNHNGAISVAAPGAGIVGINPDAPNGMSVVSCGTSTATPHVSSLAALLFAQDPARTPADVRALIEGNADDVNTKVDDGRFQGPDEYYGHGRINFARALRRGLEIRDGLPQLPVVDEVSSTIPRAINGAAQATAIGRAAASKTITQAEWWVDHRDPNGPASPVEVGAPDASGAQSLTANISVPLDFSTGVHRLFIRAKDANGWGPASVGPLIVDRAPPKVAGIQASNAVPVAGIASQITFNVSDDYSAQATYSFTVTHYLAGGADPIYTSDPRTVDIPTTVQADWMPQLTDVGTYAITVTVRDQAGNPANAVTTVIVV